MQSHARVVVIGGGNMGAGVLYHLAHMGWTDCVLIEKAEPAGLLGMLLACQWLVVNLSGRFMIMRLISTKGSRARLKLVSVKLRFVACSHQPRTYGMDQSYPRLCIGPGARGRDHQRCRGCRLNPLYNVEKAGVLGAIYTPDDAKYVDPSGTCQAMVKGTTTRR